MARDTFSHDILWYIFKENATDEQIRMEERLKTTINSTHVCQAWRNVLLESQGIWGKNISINCLHRSQQYPRMLELLYEVLRRSGDSPLWIEAIVDMNEGVRRDRALHAYDFLTYILSNNWNRIQGLTIHVFGLTKLTQMDDFQYLLSNLTKPSPTLQKLRMLNSENSTYFRWTAKNSNNLFPLFSNSAPCLRFLQTDFFNIPSRAPWFADLTTLITSETSTIANTVHRTLDVLSRMPSLVHVELAHPMRHRVDSVESIAQLPIVDLQFLQYMFVRSYPLNVLAVVDRIKGSQSGVAINVAIIIDDLDLLAAQHTLLPIYERTFLNTVTLRYPEGLHWIFAQVAEGGITIADAGCFNNPESTAYTPSTSSKGIIFSIQWTYGPDIFPQGPEGIDKFISKLLIFDTVQILRFDLCGVDFDFCPRITTSPAIRSLEITTRTAIAYETASMASMAHPSSEHQGSRYFPKLSTLAISSSFSFLLNGQDVLGSARIILRSRSGSADKIDTLKLIGFPPGLDYVRRFQGTPGLRRLLLKNLDQDEYEHVYS